MIKPGDSVQFFIPECDTWYTGKVISICGIQSLGGNDYWVVPDKLDGIEHHCSYLTEFTIDFLKSNNGYHFVNNISSYCNKYVYLVYSFIDVFIKLNKEVKSNLTVDGCKCKSCQHYIQYAVPNQSDNSFVCYSCKTNPIRAYY